MELAIKRQENERVQWDVLQKQENEEQAAIMSRIAEFRHKQKAKKLAKNLMIMLLSYKFINAIGTLLEDYAQQEEEANLPSMQLASKKTYKPDRGKLANRRKSKINKEEIDLLNNTRLICKQLVIQRVRDEINKKVDPYSKAFEKLRNFVLQIGTCRLFDLCILVANFNISVFEYFRNKSAPNHNMMMSRHFLKEIHYPFQTMVHLNKTMAYKFRLANSFSKSSRLTLEELLDIILEELLPFSSHWTFLQFDRSFYLVKRTKMEASIITECEIKSKVYALKECLRKRFWHLSKDIQVYRKYISDYSCLNHRELQEYCVHYSLSQGYEHLNRVNETRKAVLARLGQDESINPYPYFKGTVFFTEEIVKDYERPSLKYTFTRGEVIEVLDHYNKKYKQTISDQMINGNTISKIKSLLNMTIFGGDNHTSQGSSSSD